MEPWDQQPGEPALWYARFEEYRQIGPHRTHRTAYRRCAQREGLVGKSPDKGWYAQARRWQWAERAAAWDEAQRERLRREDGERRFDARELRLAMIRDLMDMVFAVMKIADLPAMDTDEARRLLPTLRGLFRDLISAERLELGLPVAQGDEGGPPLLNADDLVTAQRQLAAWQAGQAAPAGLYDIFLSYALVDGDFALGWLLPRLRDAGVTVAVDIDDFRPGAPVLEEVERCVETSRYTVAVVTAAWVDDHWTTFEILLRQDADVDQGLHRLIPLLLEACDLPRRLAALQMVDMLDAGARDRQLARVVKMVRP